MSTTVTIPTTEEHDEVVLAAGEADRINDLIRVGDFLYGCTILGSVAKLLKIDRNDFSNRTIYSFANDGNHINALDLVYAPSKGRIYVLFGDVTQIRITEVNPSTGAMTDAVIDTDYTSGVTTGALTTDDTSLFVLTYPGASSAILKYNLTGFARTILTLTGYQAGRCIRWSGSKLFATGETKTSSGRAWVMRVSAALSIEEAIELPASVAKPTDDFDFSADKIWIGFENTSGLIWTAATTNLAAGSTINTGIAHEVHCVKSDGSFIWALFDNGNAVRIDPSTSQRRTYTLNSGQGYISELVAVGQVLYVSFFGAPTKIASYRVIPYGAFQWVQLPAAPGTANDYGYGVTVDSSGNVIWAGQMEGTIAVRKYSSAGALLWTAQYGSGAALGVATDSAGNVYVTGYYNGGANFGGGTLAGAGYSDIFVLKLAAADGAHVWSKGFSGVNEDVGRAIALDASGDVFVTGFFSGAITFGGPTPLSAQGPCDIFLVKLSGTNGSWIWSQRFGSNVAAENDLGYGVAVDGSGNVYITGCFVGAINFGGSDLNADSGGSDIFIAKFSGSGTHLWSKRLGGNLQDIGLAIDTFSNGDVAVCGYFMRTADFGNGPVTSTGQRDIFIARYAAADGAHVWSRTAGGAYQADDVAMSVAVDAEDNLYTSGKCVGSMDLGAGAMSAEGGYAFVARLDPSTGVAVWSKSFGGQSNTIAACVAANANGVNLAGSWYNQVDFGNGSQAIHVGGGDAFVLQLAT